jgi:hypothetical protein
VAYKLLLTTSADVTVPGWPQDNVMVPAAGLTSPIAESDVTGLVADLAAKRALAPRTSVASSSATPTPNADTTDLFALTAQAAAAAFANPTGTPVNGQLLTIRIKDNGTARALTWGTAYVAGGVALPSTTVLSKILTLGLIYNTDNALNKWQLVASALEDATAASGTLSLLKAGSGTSTAAGATNVDTIAISGLTALDTLYVVVEAESATQATAGLQLYNVTDGVIVAELTAVNAIPIGQQTLGHALVRQRQSGGTTIRGSSFLHRSAGTGAGTQDIYSVNAAFVTAWTAAWTLALRHTGVTAGGTFSWTWAAYKVAGQ